MAVKKYRDLEGISYSLSKPVPPEVYEHLDLPLLFRPRISIFAKQVDEAIRECRKDLKEAGAPPPGHGTLSEVAGSSDSLWFPESLCDRLKIIAYLNEYAMVHDNWVDNAKTSEEYDETNASLAFLRGNENAKHENKSQKAIQAKFVFEMLATGNIYGKIMIDEYKVFLEVSSDDRDEALKAPTFEEYAKVRREDSAASFFLHQINFCKENSPEPDELKPIDHLMDLVGHILGLTNDYCSYEKEVDEWNRRGQTGLVVNAVSVLMRIHNLDAQEGKRLLYKKIIDLQIQYCNERDDYIRKNKPGINMMEYLAALEKSIAGNALWHATSPRYTSWKQDRLMAQSSNRLVAEMKPKFEVDSSYEQNLQATIPFKEAVHHPLGRQVGSLNSSTLSYLLMMFGFWMQSVCGFFFSYRPQTSAQQSSGCVCAKPHFDDEIPAVEKNITSTAFSVDSTLENDGQLPESADEKPLIAFNSGYLKLTSYETTMGEVPDETIMQPFQYIASLPSGGARDTLVDALNAWYQVSGPTMKLIQDVVATVHNISLMLDDIEDSSPLRRGSPSAHMVFGTSQTINTATFMYAKCSAQVMGLSRQAAVDFFYELQQLNIGQGKDLYWTYHCQPPTLTAYFECLEQKTGGIFRLVSKMMQAEAATNKNLNITKLMTVLGRYYQLRDDFKDITESDAKGENYNDLDQGTFTLPIIHALSQARDQDVAEMKSMLQSRNQMQTMSTEMKTRFVAKLKEAGSIEYTKTVLDDLHQEMEELLRKAEDESGVKNWILRLMLHKLKI